MSNPRVAVYLDFDNIVISRYDQVHPEPRDAWRADNARDHTPDPNGDDLVDVRLAEATVDIGAILDYAASFGTVSLARAYADWSVPANAAYRPQLVNRAVDLTQLFPVSGTKNGADIRLAIDAVEHLIQYADLTHVVIVGGDSDYIALAQRCKQLGRFVVGIGVTGSTSRALIAACDEFSQYDALPGLTPTKPKTTTRKTTAKAAKKPDKKTTTRRATKRTEADPLQDAADLLVRAVRIAQDRADDDEWLNGGGVKSQMQRMDPSFKEKALGFKTFTNFVESLSDLVETRTDAPDGHLRLRLRTA